MFSKEFTDYLSNTDSKSGLKQTKKDNIEQPKSMYYLILKCSSDSKRA